MWGETLWHTKNGVRYWISTHSPRVGRDLQYRFRSCCPVYFNPLSPCGERQLICKNDVPDIVFQPTLPVWGETSDNVLPATSFLISTHSPRVGRDAGLQTFATYADDFNPLSPCGERHASRLPQPRRCDFNPLSPCGERHGNSPQRLAHRKISTHSPRVGRDLQSTNEVGIYSHFNPLSPCGERQQNLLINHVQITFKLQQFVQKHQYKWSKYIS